jgi:hypothetical protein
MSSIVAYNAQGKQVNNYSTLFNGVNGSNNLNAYHHKQSLTKMPQSLPSNTPQTYPVSKSATNYKPQALLHKQLQTRYNQIHSQPKTAGYTAYAGAKPSEYAEWK